jgi:hypothetical protein
VGELNINPGGVDPLGLRQINFRLMDQVIPGFNNIARHIRPYSLLAWAWHRAASCAKAQGHKQIDPAKMRDFVNRMEFLFVWSQFLIAPDADLPGRETFLPYLNRASFRFGDKAWIALCDRRKNSTSLDSALNYGPAVKYLGWLVPMKERTFACAEQLVPAITAFEASLGNAIEEPVFQTIGKIAEISREAALRIGTAWNLDAPTRLEQDAMQSSLMLRENNEILSRTAFCIRECVAYRKFEADYAQIRIDLCGLPSPFAPPPETMSVVATWRIVQLRQLFRLALEALLHWTVLTLYEFGHPLSTSQLVDRLLTQAGTAPNLEAWLLAPPSTEASLPERIGYLQDALEDRENTQGLAMALREALAFSLSEDHPDMVLQETDRLPIAQAKHDVATLGGTPLHDALMSILEKWVFGQHVFWAVSRGLGDARARGARSILRLKVLQDETGWQLAPGINLRSIPRATEDRIETFVSLLKEAGALGPS